MKRKPGSRGRGTPSAPPPLPPGGRHVSEEEGRRMVCNLLHFWLVCPAGRCARARQCLGDAQACFRRHWWAFTEEERQEIRDAVRARAVELGLR